MARSNDKEDDSSTDYDGISGMADRLKLKGKERSRYIHEHMTGLGYRAVPNYVKADQDDDDEGRSRYSLGRSRRSGRSRDHDDDDDDFF